MISLATSIPVPAGADLRELADRGEALRTTVLQSAAIHPDWTVADHLSFLVNDAFVLDSADDLVAVAGWVVGWRCLPAAAIVEYLLEVL